MVDGGWVAMAHCDCGTTLQSDVNGNPGMAVGDAHAAFSGHLRIAKTGRCGVDGQRRVHCGCDQCLEHDLKLSDMVRTKPASATDLGLCACGKPGVDDLGDCGASYLVCRVCKDRERRW